MGIANRVRDYLDASGIDYDTISHAPTELSARSASVSHVKGDRLAKTVVLHDGERYLLGVVPSTHRVELNTLGTLLDCRVTLATENEAAKLFDDCALGADPPLGDAYDLPVVIDESLLEQDEVFFEGGDHKILVHVRGKDFSTLMKKARRGRFSHHI